MVFTASTTTVSLSPYFPLSDSADGCTIHYRTFQWELDGTGDLKSDLYFSLLVLSSSSSALFFSSYCYFADSLSKVLGLLTLEVTSDGVDKCLLQYSTLFVALNSCVWVSILLLWTSQFLNVRGSSVLDSVAQYSLAVAALTTCVTFAILFKQVFFFLRRCVLLCAANIEMN